AAALRFHDYARDRNPPIRRGKVWDDVRKPLVERLREVRLRQLDWATGVADWIKAREYGTRLMNAYPKDAEIAQKVGTARIAEAETLLKSSNHNDHVRARIVLDEFTGTFPGAGGDAVRKLREQINREAVLLYERAMQSKKAGNRVQATREVEQAAELD